MSEVLISPNFDKSLSNGSFVDLNKPSNNSSSPVTLDGLGRSLNQHDHTHIRTSYDTPSFRLPLKQAAKTFFRDKATKLILDSTVNDNAHAHHHHHHHNHHHQRQYDSSFQLKVNKLNSLNSDCSTSVHSHEHLLLSNALNSHSNKQSTTPRTPFMRSSIVYNVLNTANTNDSVKHVNSKKIIPLKVSVSLNDDNIQHLDSDSIDSTIKLSNGNHRHFTKNTDSNNNSNSNSSSNSSTGAAGEHINCSESTMLSSPNSSSPCESPQSPSLTSSVSHSNYQHHSHHLTGNHQSQHQQSTSYRLNSMVTSNGIDHQMASVSPKSVTPIQKITNNSNNRSSPSASVTSMQMSSGKSVSTTATTESTVTSNNTCANGNSNQLDHRINENGPRFGPGRRDPKCARCQNHNVFIKVKGHKLLCPFKNCRCKKCRLVKKRQRIMAKQVKVRRAQTSYGENRLESEQIDALIGDDDIDDGDDEDDVDDGENSRMVTGKSNNSVKNHDSNGEKGFFMENLLRVDEDKTISPAILDSFYQLLLIRLSAMNVSVAYEIALRMATSSILELASIRKTNSNEILEKKFESAISLLKNRYSTHYYPFYESNVLTSLLGNNEGRISHHESSMTTTSPNLSDLMNDTGHENSCNSNTVHNSVKLHVSPIVDLRNQHSTLFTNGTSSSASSNSSSHNQSTNSNHHGHSLHGFNSLVRTDTSSKLSQIGHLHLYTNNNNDDSHAVQLLQINHHRSNHFLPHHNHISSLHNRANSPPESPNLSETNNQFRSNNRINSVSSSNVSSSSPSPPS